MQIMGYYIVFRVRQMELKSEVQQYLKSHIDDRNVTRLQFPLHSGKICDERFKWEDEGEFEFEGSMYDVINSRSDGNSITIYCLEDDKENELLKSFADMQGQQDSNKGKSESFFQFFASLYIIPQQTEVVPIHITNLVYYRNYNSFLLHRSSEIITPPPQGC